MTSQTSRGEVGLALETEAEDWQEADHEAGDDHGLVELEVPDGQQGQQEGGEDDADTLFIYQADCGEAEENQHLDEKDELGKLPEDCEHQAEAVDGGKQCSTSPGRHFCCFLSQELTDHKELEEYEGQREMFP